MRIVIPPETARANELFMAEWSKRHPATPPPPAALLSPLTPEQRLDPLWREAEELRRACTEQAHREMQAAAGGGGPAWAAFPFNLICPSMHRVSPDAKFCPECGAAVPGAVAQQARAMTEVATAKEASMTAWYGRQS